MNSLYLTPAWNDLKQKLKERYQHLTDADLESIESEEWLQCVQRRAGGSPLEIAHLVEEVTEKQNAWPHLIQPSERERICA